ncbi:poly(3-hydroxybutyrate) synthase subunit [Methylocaldum marinum]|uniref:Poly(3-hydroxybutyrate) synthase subunit n=1 Tax=Methylocaldum marinum TaxID=1432792 RepID=A0A250KMD6_9GAMM|nr:alpha/beta fold hydrolase [Methylocaldum marinum]BBA32712.1 poly(3-hydroxybutyrate) synthase subunit [Methylocaldum marinum]
MDHGATDDIPSRPDPRLNLEPWLFEPFDRFRRGLGIWFDLNGLGPEETPFRIVMSEPGLTLRSYSPESAAGPVLLIVPAPIKRAYIWDLVPWASVVRSALEHGLSVYLAYWEPPGGIGLSFGLREYADRLILDCVAAIEKDRGSGPVFLAGHSLGGTLATFFAALHPDFVKGLILVGSPLHFGPEVGVIDRWIATAPAARYLTSVLAPVAGSLLSGWSFLADPLSFGWRRGWDGIRSLGDPRARRTYLAVERWACDEMPMAPCLFEEIVEWLYREDRFMRGELSIGGHKLAPASVRAPVVSVVDPKCRIVPPEAVLPFLRAVGTTDVTLIRYGGDVGVSLQHLGMLVGQEAHRTVWPEIMRWLQSRAD